MKRKSLAVLSATTFFFISACHLFSGKQSSVSNPLLGNWKIDSIAAGTDSSSLGYLLLAMSVDDSAAYDYRFDKDSVTFFSQGSMPYKTAYSYNDSSRQLMLKDSTAETYEVKRLNDSITGLQGKDSGIIYLKKQ